ncbi:hypothetical protein [Kordia jejudonensis]|uniref:hypothetical protein n=1 Tax=Kordia jejudonensis TaxID=1348245 RepID=UPI000629AF96|nr:hypothetical protein [Kordia jejudonensis]
MKRLLLFLYLISTIALQAQDLNAIFENCLISDTESNIARANPIYVTEIDEANNRIKTNYTHLEKLLVKATGNQSWFITQSEEAATIVEIKNVDLKSGWITLGETYAGVFNMDEGETLEFFNPFINYEIIHNKPLFKEYPTYIQDAQTNYIQSGGIIKRSNNDYVLLTPVVFGAHATRAIYYATSSDLENWTFHDKKILDTSQISFAKKEGNVFSTGNPLQLKNGNYLVLLGVEQPNGNYTSAYMILDKELKMVQAPKEIQIPAWHGEKQNSFPLAITKHKGVFRVLFHRRSNRFIASEVHEITTKDILKAFDKNQGIISSNCIQKAKNETGYVRGKADDASYLTFKSKLYILLGSEELPSEYLTSFNREYGLLTLENDTWTHDKRSPLLVNPMTIHHKYPEYEWTADHLGGFISPIIHNNYLYLFLTFGTDNPDYLLGGLKIKTD